MLYKFIYLKQENYAWANFCTYVCVGRIFFKKKACEVGERTWLHRFFSLRVILWGTLFSGHYTWEIHIGGAKGVWVFSLCAGEIRLSIRILRCSFSDGIVSRSQKPLWGMKKWSPHAFSHTQRDGYSYVYVWYAYKTSFKHTYIFQTSLIWNDVVFKNSLVIGYLLVELWLKIDFEIRFQIHTHKLS